MCLPSLTSVPQFSVCWQHWFSIGNLNNLPSHSLFSDHANSVDFALLFQRRRQRNVQAKLLFCSLNILFCHLLITIGVVICLMYRLNRSPVLKFFKRSFKVWVSTNSLCASLDIAVKIVTCDGLHCSNLWVVFYIFTRFISHLLKQIQSGCWIFQALVLERIMKLQRA